MHAHKKRRTGKSRKSQAAVSFCLITVELTCNVILVSGVQHSDPHFYTL